MAGEPQSEEREHRRPGRPPLPPEQRSVKHFVTLPPELDRLALELGAGAAREGSRRR